MPTFLVQSLGCKVSQYDGQRLEEHLRTLGFVPVAGDQEPDLFILNSCSVTGRAAQKVRQALGAVRRRWPAAKLVLAGCEAKNRDLAAQSSPEADGVLLPNSTLALVEELIAGLGFALSGAATAAFDHTPIAKQRTRAFLKIQDGCRQFCAYCIVPHLRGDEVSKSISDAVQEARQLVQNGFRELVITGIHLGRYAPGLVPFLREIETISGLDRIRLSSIESVEVGDDLIDWLATSVKACAHLHLPLQSGSDEILRAMNRPYTTADFQNVVERLRRRLPDIGITTDFMVGFPGESDALFAESLRFAEMIGFSRMHIFRYSPREGTPAATMCQQVDGRVKRQRAERAEEVWRRSALAFHRRFIGRTVEVLWETCIDNIWRGMSREYIPCESADHPCVDLTNTIQRVNVQLADQENVVVRSL
ncbi:MAG TPA: MiaB/RimO family radical SAM methylthiotransferase [Candidatus Ozemobacteraceae bacterium]|nr:MiaB/RimO family radical SAM methylthiotransferase [Candidatus Ozemobacteraceae bacterium]